MSTFLLRATVVFACFSSIVVHAAEIVVGQCVPLSGTLARTGEAMAQGVRIAVEAANASGGINGQKIRLVQQDDGYDTARTVQCTEELIAKDKAVALIGYAGTGNIAELLKRNTLSQANIALVAPYTGGTSLREPFNPYIFHIRASYDDETRTMVNQFIETGITRVAVFYQNDAFGQSGLASIERALLERNLKPVSRGSYEKNTENVDKAVEDVMKGNPQAVIMIAVTNPAALFVKKIVPRSPGMQIFAISIVNGEELYRIAGADNARGVGITQVVPSPFSGSIKAVREYLDTLKQYAPGQQPSYASFEEYIGARVLITALKRAGANPSPAAVLKALENTTVDVSGFKVAFGPQQRTGSKFVAVTLIGQGGKHFQ